MPNKKDYGIGLDMGTSSVGWAVTDKNNKVQRIKGKDAIGARLFDEGKTAADTRGFRASRRRYNRRKWRLRLLREIFDESITKIDPNFFARLKYSSESPKDEYNHGYSSKLFNDISNRRYYKNFPTIYHLRHELMTKDFKFDIRLIYLALHHIVKYRGNFLMGGSARDFGISNVKWDEELHNINELIQDLYPDLNLNFNLEDTQEIGNIFLDDHKSGNDKQKEVTKLLLKGNDQKAKPIITAVTKGIAGLTVNFYDLFNLDLDKTEQKRWKFSIDQWDDHVDELNDKLTEIPESFDIINVLKKLYSVVQLNGIVPDGKTISETMMDIYDKHHKQLKVLKQYAEDNPKLKDKIQDAYDRYINNNQHNGKNLDQDNFYKQIKNIIKDDDGEIASQIRNSIDDKDYLLKQRTKGNSVIPYQLHQREMDQIIENQGRFYPWLTEENPVKKPNRAFPYKLDELVGFRVPYYVGPLTTSEHSKFAWMTRKENGPITPWNFDRKVDRMQSADDFIQRMKTTDTILIGEDVLPQNSLLYQKYNVLNELNKIRINGRRLSIPQKQRIYKECFMVKKVVHDKDIIDNMRVHSELATDEDAKVEGLSSVTHFNSSLGTYLDFKSIMGADNINEILNNDKKRQVIENIIAWSTTFEDKKIYRAKLDTIKGDWLSTKQKDQLSSLRYTGWGRFSKKLLSDMHDKKGSSIIDYLWKTNKNFMQIVNTSDFEKQIEDLNDKHVSNKGINETIDGMFTSPQNKRSIRQVMLIIEDIVKANHGKKPSWIYIETAKEKQGSKRTISRAERLKQQMKTMSKEIQEQLQSKMNDKKDFNDRLVLYFQQNGRDMYDPSQKLDIDKLSQYDIDHILPQSLVKDDSLDNRVLTSKINNEKEKGTQFAANINKSQSIQYWKELFNKSLITKNKYNHLTMTPNQFNDQSSSFIARQLVETRQVIKLVTDLINNKYPDTDIINVKSGLSSDFRKTFDFPKNREVNDYHHAFDAYLAAMIGNYLRLKKPSWKKFFMYGDYNKVKPSFDHLNNKNQLNFIYEMKHNNQVPSDDTGEIIWDKERDLKYMRQLYNWKELLLTHRPFTQHASMFKQTVFPASNSKSLIPIKENKPTNLYGGYTSVQKAYYMIVKVYKKKSEIVLLSIYQSVASKLNQTRNKQEFNSILFDYLKQRINQRNVYNMKILFSNVNYEQLFESHTNDGHSYRYRISGDWRSDKQLYMPLKLQQMLIHNPNSDNLNQIFDYICDQMKNYFPVYGNQRNKILNNQENFYDLSIVNKKDIIKKLLEGLHSNGKRVNLSKIGASNGWGRLPFGDNGGKLNPLPDYVIYQSPTGLFERKVPIDFDKED